MAKKNPTQRRIPRETATAECPTPTKLKWDNKRAAKRYVARMHTQRDRGNPKPYLCPCGYFHVGHKPGSGYLKAKREGRLDDPTFDPREA